MTPSDPENSSKNSGLHEDSRTAAPTEAEWTALLSALTEARRERDEAREETRMVRATLEALYRSLEGRTR